ncbi:MAG: AAA family ATPase [Planctomycetia bacterium]|nr:AAA family ATPase [Planctomycetia bacterium]
MFHAFTDRAQRALDFAHEEARRLRHDAIDTAHLLLGLIDEGSSVAATVLARMVGDLGTVERAVETALTPGPRATRPERFTLTAAAKKALDLALVEASDVGLTRIAPEHLLLGLVREGDGIAAKVLAELHVSLEALRGELLHALREEAPSPPPPPASIPITGSVFDGFDRRARKVLGLALQEAQRFGHDFIGTEHLLLGLVKEGTGIAACVLRNLDIDPKTLREEIEKRGSTGTAMTIMGQRPFTPRAKKVLGLALEEARNLGHVDIGTEHLLLALLREGEGTAAQVLRNLKVKAEDVREEVLELLGEGPVGTGASAAGDGPSGAAVATAEEGPRPAPPPPTSPAPRSKTPALDAFTTDAAATEPGLPVPPLVGREAVLERVLAVLHRQRHRNVALVGPPGVGKTALVDELARRMAAGDRVGRYAGHRVLRLDVAMLVAGTKYRGQLEERARALVTEVRRAGNVVLHVEDPETLSSNGYQGESMTVAEALAPLTRGDVGVVIVSATPDVAGPTLEHLRLAHLYSRVEVPEPEPTAARAMVAAHREVLAAHHDVELTDDALDVAIAGGLTLVDRHLPSSALDLLDETCARVARSPRATRRPVVDAASVRATLAAYRAPDG